MQKKITYFVQNYEPHWEAISKEVEMLHRNFRSDIFNITTSNPMSLAKTAKIPFIKSDIYHIYTSLGDKLFLPRIRGEHIVLTGSAATTFSKLEKYTKFYEKIEFIVVESKNQMTQLLDLGVSEEKIRLIRPGIDLDKFSPLSENHNDFTVLFASAPSTERKMRERGIPIILECAFQNPDIKFILIWRNAGYVKLNKKIKSMGLRNVFVKNSIVLDMKKEYSISDCVVAPYTSIDEEKPVPRSIIESLACGKPVLVSTNVDIRDIVASEKCGIVFNPSSHALSESIGKIRKNYFHYLKNCRRTAEKYFSKEDFIENYRKLYSEV